MDELVGDTNYVEKNLKKPIQIKTIEDMEHLYETQGKLPNFHFYTHITWEQRVSDCLGTHWFKTLDRMKELAPDGDYSRVLNSWWQTWKNLPNLRTKSCQIHDFASEKQD